MVNDLIYVYIFLSVCLNPMNVKTAQLTRPMKGLWPVENAKFWFKKCIHFQFWKMQQSNQKNP